jgi:arsenical pump membrane protein
MIWSAPNIAILLIAALTTLGILVRPGRAPEALWAVFGAGLIVLSGLLPLSRAVTAAAKGNDVYLFLVGMMLLSEVARREGLFDWIATHAVNWARGSPRRLFFLIYAVGTVVTIFMSNDATAVVLTPAVYAATKKAKIQALPFLLICALVANAASFVLPISNPANLVLYGNHIPALGQWVTRFIVPSLLSIAVTYLALRFVVRKQLAGNCEHALRMEKLSFGGRIALVGIVVTGAGLLTVSSLDLPLGAPTAILGGTTLAAVCALRRNSPWPYIREVSWLVLPLVAGLFIIVEALNGTGLVGLLADALHDFAAGSEDAAAIAAGGLIAFASNLVNNLPAGLVARSVLDGAHISQRVTDAVLVGVDLGPNLSMTGSLATLLWLTVIRREGENVTFMDFLKVGVIVMPPALGLSILALLLS